MTCCPCAREWSFQLYTMTLSLYQGVVTTALYNDLLSVCQREPFVPEKELLSRSDMQKGLWQSGLHTTQPRQRKCSGTDVHLWVMHVVQVRNDDDDNDDDDGGGGGGGGGGDDDDDGGGGGDDDDNDDDDGGGGGGNDDDDNDNDDDRYRGD